MTMRKTLSLIVAAALSCSVLFTSVVSAESISEQKLNLMIAAGEITVRDGETENTPEAKIGKDAAITIAKKMLEDPSLYEVGYVALDPSQDGTNNRTWNIEFTRSKAPGGNASVGVNSETGEMVRFSSWEGSDGQTNYAAKLTRAEARVKAEEYLKKQFKESPDNYELQKGDPYLYGYRTGGAKEQVAYNFTYIKKVNGIPFTNYTINIEIDGVSGKVRSFYINRVNVDEKKFPPVKNILTSEQAIQKLKDMVSVKLQYVSAYSNVPYGKSKQKVMLAYTPTTYINMLDAATGKAASYDGSVTDLTSDEIRKVLNNPVPINPKAKLADKALAEKDAKAIAERYKKSIEGLLGISFENTNENQFGSSYYGNAGQDEAWNFNWNKNTEKGNIYFNLSISAKTGHLLNFDVGNYENSYDMKTGEGKKQEAVVEKVNWSQGKVKALGILKKLMPEQYGFYADENVKQPQLSEDAKKYAKEHSYSFTRIVNGLRFRNNSISISIDRKTGALRNLNFSWSDTEFPGKTAVVSEEEAAKKYFEGIEAKLTYLLETSYVSGEAKFAEAPKLVYTFETKNQAMYGNLIIDAETGKQIDPNRNEIMPEASVGEPNLSEHWAKRSAELLMAQGILKNLAVDLDSKVTRAEAVKMLTLAKGMNYYGDGTDIQQEPTFKDVTKESEYFLYVENAINQKIISKDADEFKGDIILTKAEFVKLLINLIGYSDLAKHKDIFKVNGMANVPEDMTGYVAIASVLDILPVKIGTTFNGSEEVTYGEAATALYKALSLIR